MDVLPKKTGRMPVWIISVGSFVVWAAFLAWLLLHSSPCKDVPASAGIIALYLECRPINDIGDFLSGAFAPLAFLLVAATVLMQRRQLLDSRKVVEDQAELIIEQAKALRADHDERVANRAKELFETLIGRTAGQLRAHAELLVFKKGTHHYIPGQNPTVFDFSELDVTASDADLVRAFFAKLRKENSIMQKREIALGQHLFQIDPLPLYLEAGNIEGIVDDIMNPLDRLFAAYQRLPFDLKLRFEDFSIPLAEWDWKYLLKRTYGMQGMALDDEESFESVVNRIRSKFGGLSVRSSLS